MDEIIKLDFLTDINYIRLFIEIVILFICSKIIEHVYTNYVYSNDNKFLFTKHFFPFVLAMFLIVSVIKTSIALSLGLVGALSIIRFRTAIKEPGQLINLLVLTSLSISMAAEKEILGIIITLIYSLHSFFTYNSLDSGEEVSTATKILRISVKTNDLVIADLVSLKNFERIYKDVNKLIILEFSVASDKEDIQRIIDKVKKHGEIITYEVF